MTANERRAGEVVAACSRASYEGIDPRSVILIALDAAERRGEERALRLAAMSLPREIVAHIRGDLRARRARGGKRS